MKVTRGEGVRGKARAFGERVREQGDGSEVAAKLLGELMVNIL